jgi:hypothetical protein
MPRLWSWRHERRQNAYQRGICAPLVCPARANSQRARLRPASATHESPWGDNRGFESRRSRFRSTRKRVIPRLHVTLLRSPSRIEVTTRRGRYRVAVGRSVRPTGSSTCRVGLVDLDTWGVQGTEVSRVFGYSEGVPIETIWWPQDFAEAFLAGLVSGEQSAAAEARAGGIALRTEGLLEAVAVTRSISMSEISSATPRETLPVSTTSSTTAGSAAAIRSATSRNSRVLAVGTHRSRLGICRSRQPSLSAWMRSRLSRGQSSSSL